jgi:hypothetical protein
MVETGLNASELGKRLLAACFVTDLGTVLTLGLVFANWNIWLGSRAGDDRSDVLQSKAA